MATELDPITGLEGEPEKKSSTSPLAGKSALTSQASTPKKSSKSKNSSSPLAGQKAIDQTGYFDEMGFEAQGIGKSLQGQYGSYLKDGFDIRYRTGNEDAAQNQSTLNKIGSGVVRALGKASVELLKLPGYIGGAIFSGAMEGNFLENMTDNSYINALDSFDEGLKEALPVFTPEAVKNGNAWDKFSSASWWATDFADGLGYAAGMIGPGALIKGVGLGAGTIRVAGGIGKAFGGTGKLKPLFNIGKKLNPALAKNIAQEGSYLRGLAKTNSIVNANNIELGAATLLSTTMEAGAESKGIRDRLKESLLPKLQSGEITQEEYDNTINQAAADVFTGNFGILLVPNMITNKLLFGQFPGAYKSGSGIASAAAQEGSKGFVKGATNVGKAVYKGGKPLVTGAVREGFVEEGLQSTLEEYVANKAETGQEFTFGEFFEDLPEAYLEMMVSSEGQSAILAGAILGGSMNYVGAYRKRQADRKLQTRLNEATAGFSDTFNNNINSIYKTNEDGSLKTDTKGNPVLDLHKYENSVDKIKQQLKLSKALDEAASKQDIELYNELFNKASSGMVAPFIGLEGGREVLKEKLEGMQEFAALKFQGQQFEGNNITQKDYVDKIMSKFDQMQNDFNYHKDMILPQINNFTRKFGGTQKQLDEFKNIINTRYIIGNQLANEKQTRIDKHKEKLNEIENKIAKQNQNKDLIEGDEGFVNYKDNIEYKLNQGFIDTILNGNEELEKYGIKSLDSTLKSLDNDTSTESLAKEYQEYLKDQAVQEKDQVEFEENLEDSKPVDNVKPTNPTDKSNPSQNPSEIKDDSKVSTVNNKWLNVINKSTTTEQLEQVYMKLTNSNQMSEELEQAIKTRGQEITSGKAKQEGNKDLSEVEKTESFVDRQGKNNIQDDVDRNKKQAIFDLLNTLNGKLVRIATNTFGNLSGKLVKVNNHRYELHRNNKIYELQFNDINEIRQKYKLSSITDNSVTINNVKYNINLHPSGSIESLTPVEYPDNKVTNNKVLTLVELERNRELTREHVPIDNFNEQLKEELDKESKKDSTIKQGINYNNLINTIWQVNMTDTIATALDKLYELETLTDSEKLQVSIWINDSFERVVNLIKEDNTQTETEIIENAYQTLDIINGLLLESTDIEIKKVKNEKHKKQNTSEIKNTKRLITITSIKRFRTN